MMLQSGFALSEGVLLLQDDEPDKDGKAVLQSLLIPLEKGAPLSEALQASAFFPRYMGNMVEAGEETGRLAETLKALSEYYDKQDRLSAAIRSAVLYPAILLIIMAAVVLLLIVRVLPIFNDAFGRLGAQMSPLATKLMQFGVWFGGAGGIIAAVTGVVFIAAIIAFAMPKVRKAAIRHFMNRWGNTGIFAKIASARFTSVMSLALASGMDIGKAVEMASVTGGGSRPLDQRNEHCIRLLRSGKTLSEAMREAGILSARDSRMLSLGSRSGMADAAMAEIARRDERCVQDSIDRMVGRVEPALVIVTSAIVGVILLSVMLPLISIMTSIG